MSYNDDLKLFNDRKLSEASDKSGEQLISWYLSNEPFGLYFAAKELWKKTDQISKDKALDYYEQFVKHPDITEEKREVKTAIKTVLNAYRNGYGTTKKEQLGAAESFERAIVYKGFTVPAGEKRPTEMYKKKEDRKISRFNIGTGIISALGGLVMIGGAAVKVAKQFIKKE